MMTLDEFFEEQHRRGQLFKSVCSVISGIGFVEFRGTESHIALRGRKAFASVWMPVKYLRGRPAPLGLTLPLLSGAPSPRWKDIVEPSLGRLTHHLELYSSSDIGDRVRGWLREACMTAAWVLAGARGISVLRC
jgi:hypothetical protein